MQAVRSNNIVTGMFAHVAAVHTAIYQADRVGSLPRPSTVPVQERRLAVVPRSAPGPVLETMLKNWPMDRMVSEIISLSVASAKADRDHDQETADHCEHELSKLAGLCEQHEIKDPGYTKRVWERVDERTTAQRMDKIVPDLLDVPHGSNQPGTLGAELTPELREALFQMTAPKVDETPVVEESAEDLVNRALGGLGQHQQSSL